MALFILGFVAGFVLTAMAVFTFREDKSDRTYQRSARNDADRLLDGEISLDDFLGTPAKWRKKD